MDVFNSTWLVNMLAKSSKSPKGRVLSLFDILSDWINAPDIHLDVQFKRITAEELTAQIVSSSPLVNYLSVQTKALGATHPGMLAEHIALIACNAAQQQMAQPQNISLMHAKKAAEALILSQVSTRLHFTKSVALSLCACVLTLSIALAWFGPTLLQEMYIQNAFTSKSELSSKIANEDQANQDIDDIGHPKYINLAVKTPQNTLTANDAAMLYAKYEQMRAGTCQYLEVLQIPDIHKAIYIENVVGGKLPINLQDLAIANQYLEKVRCNFTPMLMANSK
jgi:hypothetical protein